MKLANLSPISYYQVSLKSYLHFAACGNPDINEPTRIAVAFDLGSVFMDTEAVLSAYNQTYKELDDLYHDVAKRAGLSDSVFEILYTLYENDGCLQRDICSTCFISKQTINSAVKTLREKGLVRFESGKRREIHVFLTDEGRALCDQKVKPIYDAERAAFAQLDDNDLEAFVRVNRTLVSALRESLQSYYAQNPAIHNLRAATPAANEFATDGLPVKGAATGGVE